MDSVLALLWASLPHALPFLRELSWSTPESGPNDFWISTRASVGSVSQIRTRSPASTGWPVFRSGDERCCDNPWRLPGITPGFRTCTDEWTVQSGTPPPPLHPKPLSPFHRFFHANKLLKHIYWDPLAPLARVYNRFKCINIPPVELCDNWRGRSESPSLPGSGPQWTLAHADDWARPPQCETGASPTRTRALTGRGGESCNLCQTYSFKIPAPNVN